jgi:hypothetical protein
MNGSRSRLAGICGVTVALALAGHPATAGDAREDVQSFRVTVLADIDMVVQGKPIAIKGDTEVDYTLRRRARAVSVVFDRLNSRSLIGGKETMYATMSRAGITSRIANGRTNELRFEDAPDGVKEMLKDSFGEPVYKILLDKDDRETKRIATAGPGAKLLLDQGLIAAARLFHPPFPADQNKWTAPGEVSMGHGAHARGELTYEKIRRTRTGQTTVKVSGVLTGDGAKLPTGGQFKKARYDVKGEQLYDATRREWSSGELVATLVQEIETPDGAVQSAKGTMRLKLQPRDAK